MAKLVLALAVSLPLVALALSIIFDRGPSGETRLSPHFFAVALWLYDDFAWTCARNSVIFAVSVTAASLVVGSAVAWAGARRRFWGGRILRELVGSLLVISPAFLALGVLGLFGPPGPWPWPMSAAGNPGRSASLESWSGLPLWGVWLWTTLPAGVALVSLAASRSVERLEPSWDDAARLAGARRLGAWRLLLWPLVRPAAARAAAVVFVFSLVEPGAALILGLRRTMAFQLIDASRRAEPFPRLAVWALMAGVIALAGSLVVRRWGGRPVLALQAGAGTPSPRRPAPPARAVASALLLAACAVAGWLPLVGLVRLSWRGIQHDVPSASAIGPAVVALVQCLRDPPVPDLVANSVMFGLAVAVGLSFLAWVVAGGLVEAPHEFKLPRPLALVARSIPPLVVGAGMVAVPWLTGLLARSVSDSQQWPALSRAVERIAALLDIDWNPWILMTVSVGVCLALWFLRAVPMGRPVERSSERPSSAMESALLAGDSRGRARRLANPGWRRRVLGNLLLVWALAATNLTPALLFAHWSDQQTVAPGILALAAGDELEKCQAALLALGAIAVLTAALGVAGGTRAVARDEMD